VAPELKTRSGYAVTLVLSLGIAAMGVGVSLFALTSGRDHPISVAPTASPGYFITLPAEVTGPDSKGGYLIDAVTNLPDETRARVVRESAEGGGGGCCISIQGGHLLLPISTNDCSTEGGTATSLPFTITVVVASDFRPWFTAGTNVAKRAWQPESVLAVLGEDFGKLAGPQVRQVGDTKGLVVSAAYKLPDETCTTG
jgi:hypothetical protein